LTVFGGNNTSGPIDVATACNAHGGTHGRLDFESETFVTHSLRADGFDASEDGTGRGTPLVACTLPASNGGVSSGYHPVIPVDMRNATRDADKINRQGCGVGQIDDPSPTLSSVHVPAVAFGWYKSAHQTMKIDETCDALQASPTSNPAVAFQSSQSGFREVATHATLDDNNGSRRHNGVVQSSAVRRLTPRECERLQGFPDDFTLVPYRGNPAKDGPRYKAIGNSMAVPVMRWIVARLLAVDGRDSTGRG